MRGYSLEQDLRLLVNDPKYSDIEILCENEKKLYACRAILAARSDVFNSLLYNGMKETYENKISFPEINFSGMKIILEYTYTGIIQEESLTVDNIVEAFYSADYFQLPDLQDFIIKVVKDNLEKNYAENYSPELLSKVVKMMPLSEGNILLNLLVEAVAIMPLNIIEFGRLPIEAFQYLLSCTYEKEKPFATTEYEVFRHSAILVAKQVSNDAYKTLTERLPALEQIKNLNQIKHKFIIDHQKVAKGLESLVKFIDFGRINARILVDIIEPLGIIPTEHKVMLNNSELSDIRGIPIYRPNGSDLAWDKACGSDLIVEDNGKVVQASNNNRFQSVRAKMILDNKGIFEWDVIIEKNCFGSWIGVCASENFNYKGWAGSQPTGWVLGSGGYCYSNNKSSYYCPSFEYGTKVTVHLDMYNKTIAFTVNGTKYPNVSEWNNLPSKLYPVVSLRYPGKFRIQPH